jgi:hypothetical protein
MAKDTDFSEIKQELRIFGRVTSRAKVTPAPQLRGISTSKNMATGSTFLARSAMTFFFTFRPQIPPSSFHILRRPLLSLAAKFSAPLPVITTNKALLQEALEAFRYKGVVQFDNYYHASYTRLPFMYIALSWNDVPKEQRLKLLLELMNIPSHGIPTNPSTKQTLEACSDISRSRSCVWTSARTTRE